VRLFVKKYGTASATLLLKSIANRMMTDSEERTTIIEIAKDLQAGLEQMIEENEFLGRSVREIINEGDGS
jgi:hypothetical protein